jgi:cellulose/xylan binding protein with CBM9 domain
VSGDIRFLRSKQYFGTCSFVALPFTCHPERSGIIRLRIVRSRRTYVPAHGEPAGVHSPCGDVTLVQMPAEIVASAIQGGIQLNASQSSPEWQRAEPVRFSADWQGKNPNGELETEVRVLWSPEMLYLRFVCRYRELFVFEDSAPNGRRDHLWDRDVAEAFLQPPPSMGRNYKEFEVAPNGMWIDLEITPTGLADLKSGLTRSVHINKSCKMWTAELGIPMQSLSAEFDPAQPWRANFYRVEGKIEPRKYIAWQATNTPEPQFHVPERFGKLEFATYLD